MKIIHNFKILEDGVVVGGRILGTIFEKGEKRFDKKQHYSRDGEFCIESYNIPEIGKNKLYVWGNDKDQDNKFLCYEFNTNKEAVQFLKYCNEFLPEEECFEKEKIKILKLENGLIILTFQNIKPIIYDPNKNKAKFIEFDKTF